MPTAKSRTDKQKDHLRKQMKARRSAVTPAEAEQAAHEVIEHIKPLLQEKRRRQVGLYHPVNSELDTLPLAHFLRAAGCRLSLPVVRGRTEPLTFRPWNIDEQLVLGQYSIRVPVDKGLSVEPDLLIVPLLAFDGKGNRLGYGGGYYDRTLERLRAAKPVLAVGLAHDFQQVAALPVNALDQRLDHIATPAGLLRF